MNFTMLYVNLLSISSLLLDHLLWLLSCYYCKWRECNSIASLGFVVNLIDRIVANWFSQSSIYVFVTLSRPSLLKTNETNQQMCQERDENGHCPKPSLRIFISYFISSTCISWDFVLLMYLNISLCHKYFYNMYIRFSMFFRSSINIINSYVKSLRRRLIFDN